MVVALPDIEYYPHVATMLKRLAGDGHWVKVVSGIAAGLPREEVEFVLARRARRRFEWSVLDASESAEHRLRDERPDVVVTCPARDGYLSAAVRLGLPTVGVVAHWAELAAGRPEPLPDLVVTWSRALAEAARDRHGLPAERLAVGGMAALDPYFDYRRDHDAEYRRERRRESVWVELGVDAARPAVLYMASAQRAPGEEHALVAALASRLDSTCGAQLVVFPDPHDRGAWDGFSAPGVTVAQRPDAHPGTQAVERLLFLSLACCDAVIAANTERLLAAVAARRPCITLTSSPGAGDDGLVELAGVDFSQRAQDVEEAASLAAALLAADDPRAAQRERFVRELIRPEDPERSPAGALARAVVLLAAGRLEALRDLTLAGQAPDGAERGHSARGDARPAKPHTRGSPGDGDSPPTNADLEQLAAVRQAHLVEVREPLVLISQIQRSGGTLLSQLLDGHPQGHCHPHELHIGHPFGREAWPQLDLSSEPGEWYERLREPPAEAAFGKGYHKGARNKERTDGRGEGPQTYPFLLPPWLQRRLFFSCAAGRTIARSRDILDCYMSSYFNAWLDNHNLVGAKKRWVVAFAARLAASSDNRERFFSDYPDGRLISIIREPASWLASARRYDPVHYGDPAGAVRLWAWSARSMLEASERHPGQVLVLRFDRLLEETEATMRGAARFLGIDFVGELCQPTFNGLPIGSNSAFDVAGRGVLAEPLRRTTELDPEARAHVERGAGELYRQVITLAG